jgi:hypothetical protein
MALDILLILVMSADLERLFSSAKITIFDCRCRLRMLTIQALECLKSWLGIIEATVDDLKEDEELTNKGDTVVEVIEVSGGARG